MAIGLENFTPFITAADANYPNGDIKDGTGVGDGTDVDRHNHADYHQTFRKLLSLAGITPNNLPDNVTNGYQYVDAILRLSKRSNGVITTASGSFLTSAQVRNIVLIQGATTIIVFGLPSSATLQDGDSFIFYNNGSYNVVIQGFGGNGVMNGPDFTLIQSGDFVELVLDKQNSNWVIANYKVTSIVIPIPFINITALSNWNVPATYLGTSNSAQYRINSNTVELRGLVKNTDTGVSTDIMTLPVGYRPSQVVYFICWSDSVTGTVTPVPVTIGIAPTGRVSTNVSGYPNNTVISLNQIRFSLDA